MCDLFYLTYTFTSINNIFSYFKHFFLILLSIRF